MDNAKTTKEMLNAIAHEFFHGDTEAAYEAAKPFGNRSHKATYQKMYAELSASSVTETETETESAIAPIAPEPHSIIFPLAEVLDISSSAIVPTNPIKTPTQIPTSSITDELHSLIIPLAAILDFSCDAFELGLKARLYVEEKNLPQKAASAIAKVKSWEIGRKLNGFIDHYLMLPNAPLG
jgi:hypothetical protein